MALSLTSWGVAQTAAGGSITMSVTSSAISVTAGSLQVVLVTLDASNNSGTTQDVNFSVTDDIGDTGGGSWTQQARCTRGAVAGNGAYVESAVVFTRFVGTSPGTSKTITVTAVGASNGYTTSADGWMWADFVQVTGQHATPIGATSGNTSRQNAGPTSYTCTLSASPASSSAVISALHADNSTTAATDPSGYTRLNESHPAWGATSGSTYKNGSAASTVVWTGLATAANHLGVALEIVAASSGSAISGSTASASTLAGSLTTTKPVTGTTTSASTLGGSLSATKPITASTSSASTLTAALTVALAISGAATSASTLTATLGVAKPLAGSTTSASTLSAALVQAQPLAGSASSASTLSGTLSLGSAFSGTSNVASTLSATIRQAQALTGSGTVASTLTGALSVGGAVAYWKVAAPAAHSGPNNLTLAARFNANSWGGSTWWFGSGTIVAIDASADVNDRLHIETFPGTPGVVYGLASVNAESNISQEEAGGLTTGTWHHVAFTIGSAGALAIYIDGSLVTGGNTETGGLTAWAGQAWGQIWIGDFDGILHDVVIYDAALNATEIATLAAFRNPTRTANLVGYWPLDTSDPTADLSGNGRTLTATGTPSTSNAAGGTPWAVFGATSSASTLAGTLTNGWALAGSTSSASTLTGTLSVAAGLAGSASSASTLAAALSVAKPLTGSSAVASTLSATLGTGAGITGTSAVASTLSATLTQLQAFGGAQTVASTLTGSLGVSVPLVASTTSASTLGGTLGIAGVFSGATTSASTLSATLAVTKPIAGSASSASTLAAALGVAKPLAGTVSDSSTLAGTLGIAKPLAGSSLTASTLSATLQQGKALAGSAGVSSTLAGTLRQANACTGTAAVSSTLTGTLTGGTTPITMVVSGWADGGDIQDTDDSAPGPWAVEAEADMARHGKWYEDPASGGTELFPERQQQLVAVARSSSRLVASGLSEGGVQPALAGSFGAGSFWLQRDWQFGTSRNIGNAAQLNAEFQYHDPFNTITNGTNYGAMIVRAAGAPAFGVWNWADIGMSNDQQPEDTTGRYRTFTGTTMQAHVKPLNTGSTVVGPASAHNAGCGSIVSKYTLPSGGARLGADIVWETRVRMVTAPDGYWFALWIVGPQWDGGPEIDVIEGFSSTSPNVNGDLWNSNGIGGTNNQPYFSGPWDNVISTLGIPGYALPNGSQTLRNWHTFTMYYSKTNAFSMYMDSTLIQSGVLDWKVPTGSTVPTLQFLFDFGFGHTQISPINAAVIADINATPLTYEIDYSRIWLR